MRESALLTGSLAYDYLMNIAGKFTDRWPVLADGGFAAAYTAPALSRRYGGCAGNIAYALQHLDAPPTIMATAGHDFSIYDAYLRALRIDTAHILVLSEHHTAQAYVVTDEDKQQFIVFHPGAAGEAHRQSVNDIPTPPLAIVSPNGKDGMLQHCRQLGGKGVPFIFDPGQAIGLFSANELAECLRHCTYAIMNTAEFASFQDATKLSQRDIVDNVQALILTHGINGSEILTKNGEYRAPSVRIGETKDPTGCGDAYRAGLIYGLLADWQWPAIIRFSAVIAGIKASHDSAQGYTLSPALAREVYAHSFPDVRLDD